MQGSIIGIDFASATKIEARAACSAEISAFDQVHLDIRQHHPVIKWLHRAGY
jgi:hypothetical protein